MICEECGQNEATVSFAVSVGEERTVRHICAECMKKKSLALVRGNLGSFLGSVLAVMNEQQSENSKTCDRCGMTWGEFKKTGHLGCSGCYSSFAQELKPVLQKIHGCAQHTGKHPEETGEEPRYVLSQTIERLQEKMAQAVAEENFEEAAAIRDEIKALSCQQEAME